MTLLIHPQAQHYMPGAWI